MCQCFLCGFLASNPTITGEKQNLRDVEGMRMEQFKTAAIRIFERLCHPVTKPKAMRCRQTFFGVCFMCLAPYLIKFSGVSCT